MSCKSQDLCRKSQVASHKIRGLYGIVDNTFSPEKSHIELAGSYLVGGCRLLQLRIKKDRPGPWDQNVFEIARGILRLKDRYDFTFIINDYVDVAAELRADGVHVGANDLPVDEIKARVGTRLMVGYSAHAIDEAVAAEKRGADYVAFGAIYPTKTKGPGHPVQGVEKLRDLVSRVSVPVVAIGGINRSNVDEVWSTGVAAAAMITGLTQADDVAGETRWHINKLKY